MKSISFILNCVYLLLLFVFGTSCNKEETKVTKEKTDSKQETSGEKKSPGDINLSNDFLIEYETEGLIKGNMKIIKKGDKFKQKMNAEIRGMKTSNDVYVDGDVVYTVTDLSGVKTGFKTDLSDYNKKKQSGDRFTDFRNLDKYLEGSNKTGTENILGYDCDVYETGKGIFLTVHDKKYVLKIKGPEFTATAVKLDKNPSVDQGEFEIPKDVDFNKMGTEGMNKEKIDELIKKYKK